MLPAKKHKLPNRNANSRQTNPAIVGQGYSRLLKQCRLLLLSYVASQNLKVNPISKDIPHASDMGVGGLELELTWKPPPWGLLL